MDKAQKEQLIKSSNEKIHLLRKYKEIGLAPLTGDFFPAVTYPPITMYPRITDDEFLKGYTLPEDGLFDVYAHIPFCEKQCVFCHYPVQINPPCAEMERYLGALGKEMDIYMARLGIDKIKTRSILIGGGTPTYLPPELLDRFLKAFTSKLDLSALTQFNVDLDPKTILGEEGKQRIKIMKAYGVDRLTIGINSFDDAVLKKMNRHHNAAQAVEAIKISKERGFVLDIEFIYGYPGQTIEHWIDTMEQAISLAPDEIQLYRLKIIPYGDRIGTISQIFKVAQEDFLSDEITLRMKHIAHQMLSESGYNERLIRVFSKNPEIFSHYAESQCCTLREIITFGYTAFSTFHDRLSINTQDFKEYYSLIEQGHLPINRGKIRTKDDQLRWALVPPLRSREIYKKVYERQTGESLNNVFRKKIERLKKLGLIYEDDKILKLTFWGRFFADEVCYQFYHPDYMPFRREDFNEGEYNPFNDVDPWG